MDDSDQPKLPPELEERTFLLAVEDRSFNPWNLLSVAKRVHEWVIPRLFRVVILDDTNHCPIRFNLPIFQRYAAHVHFLFLSQYHIIQHLLLFTNLQDLVIASFEPAASELEPLLTFKNLRCLSLMMDDSHPTPSPVYFSIFSNLTHLDLNAICGNRSPAYIEPFINFPLLTHLCILAESNIDSIKLFLDRRRCKNLQVVVFWEMLIVKPQRKGTMVTPKDELVPFPIEDDRIVQVLSLKMMEDWENGARGGDDMWKVADREVALRKKRRACLDNS